MGGRPYWCTTNQVLIGEHASVVRSLVGRQLLAFLTIS